MKRGLQPCSPHSSRVITRRSRGQLRAAQLNSPTRRCLRPVCSYRSCSASCAYGEHGFLLHAFMALGSWLIFLAMCLLPFALVACAYLVGVRRGRCLAREALRGSSES